MHPLFVRRPRSVFRFRRPARLRLVLLGFLVATVLSACGAAFRPTVATNSAHFSAAASAAQAPEAPPAQANRTAAAPVAGDPAQAGQVSPLPSGSSGQMLIRTGTIDLEAKNPAALVDQVRRIAAAAVAGTEAGYVADEQLQSAAATYTATITITVPAATFADVMQQLRSLGTRVVTETSNSQDVTAQYVDVDAQLQALHATQAQLLQLLGKTQQVADTLAVERELSGVDVQINQLEGREKYLTSHSAYSTIVVTIRPLGAAAAVQAPWSPLPAALSAIAALGAVARQAVDGLIWLLILGLPLAALLAGGIAARRLVVRMWRDRRLPARP